MSENLPEDTGSGGTFKTARRLHAAYRWSDRFQWLTSLFKTPAEIGFATTSAAVVGGVTAMTVADAVETRMNRDVAPIVVESSRQTANSTVFEIVGFDKAGRKGLFDVVVLNKEFMWVHASAEELERKGERIPAAAAATTILDADVRGALAEARDIIAVGTASQEGQAATELERARKRALKAAEIAKTPALETVPVWGLTLGQYRDPCDACETKGTSWQRPFIVIAVKDLEAGANMGEALADAMTGKDNIPAPASYSAFELTKIR